MNEVLHLAKLIPAKAKKHADQIAVRFRDYTDATWKGITWAELEGAENLVAAALLQYGIKHGDRVGIFSQNKPECIYCESAIYSLRAVGVPFYATSTTAQIEYIIKDAAIKLLFVGEQYQYDRAFEALQGNCGLQKIVIFDTEVRLNRNDNSSVYLKDFMHSGLIADLKSEVQAIRKRCDLSDLANILYTSGTTGNPKGVMLLHSNFHEIIRVMNFKLKNVIDKNQSSLSFLPMTHIFEKAWSYYCMTNDVRVDILLRPGDVQMAIKEVRPNFMCNVPRFWEKVYAGVQGVLNGFSPFMQKIVAFGIRIGEKYHWTYRRQNKHVPPHIFLLYWMFKTVIFNMVQRKVGLNNGVMFPIAGAKLNDNVCKFMRSIGIPVCYGYGLTESTATVTCFDDYHFKLGSVGTAVEGLEIKISDEGEVLLKGKTITPGYYNRPDANAESFTEDGYFRTGDCGYLDEEGHLFLTDRLKDLFKTSNGKYIAPQMIETALENDRYIDNAVIIGDQRKFVSAIIVPAFAEMEGLLKDLGINNLSADDMQACVKDPRIYQFIENRIRLVQKDMANFEQVRRFILLPEAFSMEKGELTNTLKAKRKVIINNHLEEIDALYEN